MVDEMIVQLFWIRNEQAITQARSHYGGYCLSIAKNILWNAQDAEEAVQDALLAAWNSIPPNRPVLFKTYLGKLARRAALKKRREKHAIKRGGGQAPLVLDELADCLPGAESVEREMDAKRLEESISRFLAALKPMERRVFLCRYWYLDSTESIAERCGFSQSKVKSLLYRLRKRLQRHLEKEGCWDDA